MIGLLARGASALFNRPSNILRDKIKALASARNRLPMHTTMRFCQAYEAKRFAVIKLPVAQSLLSRSKCARVSRHGSM